MNTDKEKVFMFLDDLRESGITNMFGAAPYVQDKFEVNSSEAVQYLVDWMETFAERHAKSD